MSRKTNFMRKFRGSPYLFKSNLTEISSGGRESLELDKRFSPYDEILIINLNTSNNATILINGSMKQPLPKGNELIVDTPAEFLSIINDGTTSISIGEIKVYYKNSGWEGKAIINKARAGIEILSNIKILRGFSKW